MDKHNKMPTLECDECGFKTIWTNTLQSHHATKCGTKPFKCKLCDFQTIHPNNLHRHQKIHSRDSYDQDEEKTYKKVSIIVFFILI